MSNAWENPFAGEQGDGQEKPAQSETLPEPPMGSEETTSPPVHTTAPQTRKVGWITNPYIMVLVICGIASLVVFGFWGWLHFTRSAPATSSLIAFADSPSLLKTKKDFGDSGLIPPVADKSSQQPVQETLSTPAVEKHRELPSELEEARKAFAELRTGIEEATATLRGENMATITNADLEALVQANASLQQQVESAINTIRQAKEEKEEAFRKLSEVETQYKSLEAARNKASETAKKQDAPQKAASQQGTDKAKEEPRKRSPVSRKPESREMAKMAPFTIVAATDSFIVVRKSDNEFATLKLGESLDGITLQGINAAKREIRTNVGEFSISANR